MGTVIPSKGPCSVICSIYQDPSLPKKTSVNFRQRMYYLFYNEIKEKIMSGFLSSTARLLSPSTLTIIAIGILTSPATALTLVAEKLLKEHTDTIRIGLMNSYGVVTEVLEVEGLIGGDHESGPIVDTAKSAIDCANSTLVSLTAIPAGFNEYWNNTCILWGQFCPPHADNCGPEQQGVLTAQTYLAANAESCLSEEALKYGLNGLCGNDTEGLPGMSPLEIGLLAVGCIAGVALLVCCVRWTSKDKTPTPLEDITGNTTPSYQAPQLTFGKDGLAPQPPIGKDPRDNADRCNPL